MLTGTSRVMLALALATIGFAQAPPPSPPAPDTLVSPEVNADRTVTFRIRAPKATEVSLYGDWMPVGKLEPMTKGADGVWTITAGPIEATGHLYYFNVDGMNIADPINPRIKLRQRTSASIVEVPAPAPAPWELRDVPHGVVVTEWQKSQVLNRTERFFLYLPPGYEKGSTRYPVLYLVHGSGDVPDSWTNAGNANLILDNLIADKKAVPMIIVMPAGHARPYGGGFPSNDNTDVFGQYMTKELIPAVEAKYRVAPGPKNRAMAGLSMGGGLTISTGFSHPELFSALGIFSPAVPRDFETRYEKTLADPKALNAKLATIWIGSGEQDMTTRFPMVKGFADLLAAKQVKATFRPVPNGAHTWPVWRLCLSEFAPLIFK